MKIMTGDAGEMSVGIWPTYFYFETNLHLREEDREYLRKAFTAFVCEQFDPMCLQTVHFDDECADCGRKVNKKTGLCEVCDEAANEILEG